MLNPLQTKLLEMLTWLVKYIDEHELRYYVIGGTMLGAVRHKGFIPWDDDVDIAMPRKDYEELIRLLKEPQEHYVVESPKSEASDFIYAFAKFYDMNTSMTEVARRNIKRGVYIDIFPLDGIGNSNDEAIKNYKKIDRLKTIRAIRACSYRKGRKWWKNVVVSIGNCLPYNEKDLSAKIDRLCSQRDFDDCDFVGDLVSPYRTKEIMSKDIYGKPTVYSFEGLSVYGPEKYEEYLSALYGNWRELPPEEERHSTHKLVELDMNKPYRNV